MQITYIFDNTPYTAEQIATARRIAIELMNAPPPLPLPAVRHAQVNSTEGEPDADIKNQC